MTLIKSISGIRGTIGGHPGENLTPVDIVECVAAFGTWSFKKTGNKKIVVGRDARISGNMVSELAMQTLVSLGMEVVDLGLSTTPTVEIAVPAEAAGAGIIFTASHNPKQWNALKFLNEKGEFISGQDGKEVLELIEKGELFFADVDSLGSIRREESYIQNHIELILNDPLVKLDLVRAQKYKVVVDAINSTGSLSVVPLLEQMGCEAIVINGEPNGQFAHNPEPLPAHLEELSKTVKVNRAHLGIVVDPDVDRLAFVCEDGTMFGEEYTLVAVADYVLKNRPGNTVSNLSSTRALRDVTEKHGQQYSAAAVGEVNVVNQMKATNAVIGGEGNGGIIYPALHYGRDALVGIALFLSHLASEQVSISNLKNKYPQYVISKNKMELTPEIDVDNLLLNIKNHYSDFPINTVDGVKIEMDKNWVHLRKSNTEPIIRIYSESESLEAANELAENIKGVIREILG